MIIENLNDNYIIIVALLYIISITLIIRWTPVKVITSSLILILLFLQPSVFYLSILSLISLFQAIEFLRKKQNRTSLRYFIYSMLFILVNFPLISNHYKIALFSILLIKILLICDTDEIYNPYVYISNITINTAIVIKTFSITNFFLAEILALVLILSLVRFIIDKKLFTPLYLLPLVILISTFSSKLLVLLILLYTLFVSIPYYYNNKKINLAFVCLFFLPFIDSSIFQIAFKNFINTIHIINKTYLSAFILLLAIISISRFTENHFKKYLKDISYKFIPDLLFALIILFLPVFIDYSFRLSAPIPLLVAGIFIVVDSRYVNIFSRIPAYETYTKITYILSVFASTVHLILRVLYIKSKGIPKTICKYLVFLENSLKFIYIKQRKKRKQLSKNIKYFFINIIEKCESCINQKIDMEEFIALISIFILMLIFIVGDR